LFTESAPSRVGFKEEAGPVMRVMCFLLVGLLSSLLSAARRTESPNLGFTDQNETTATPTDHFAQIKCLPFEYRDAARRDIPANVAAYIVAYQQKVSEGECLSLTLNFLALTPDGRSFLFVKADTETSGDLRRQIFIAIRYVAHKVAFGGSPLMTEAESRVLENHASSDPDLGASLEALRSLREFHTADEAVLLRRRETGTSTCDSGADLQGLENMRLEYYMWYGETRLSPFAYIPPPHFIAVPAGRVIRVLVFGDFGTGSGSQIRVARAMRAYRLEHPFDFGITLGDNFYVQGLNTPESGRWRTQWEDLYGSLGIKFYPTFGNHDYNDVDSPAAELAYTLRSETWDFPAPYYTYTAGSAQFFAIDNIRLSSEEIDWLDRELAKSTAKWKIVYGHYPIYSAGGDDDELIVKLLPVLERNHVQIYLNGHIHSMEAVRTDSSVHFFTSGAGGADLYDLQPTYKKSIFKEKQFGFTVLEIDDSHADVIFVDTDGKEIYRSHIAQ
jgi:tartrate-resistant acid phosphatase type 5